MEKFRILANDWVLVCDGGRALLLKNVGDELFLNLRLQDRYTDEQRSAELRLHRPGRVYESATPARSAIMDGSRRDEIERRFLGDLIQVLHKRAISEEISRLIVIAPAKVLGILRQSFTSSLRQRVCHEIERDLVKLPIQEIERHILRRIDEDQGRIDSKG